VKISIVTPSYNQGKYIENTIQSVLNQECLDVEHIIMDGGSTDQTVEVLKKYPHLIWASEKDRGQTHALNKGIKLCSGEIIGWINSDDFYEKNIFGTVLEAFSDPSVQWVIGKQPQFFDETGEIKPDTTPGITYHNLLDNPDILRQAPAFFRKSFLDIFLPLDESLYMTMDLDLWLRMSKVTPPKMFGNTFAYFRIQKDQKTNGELTGKQLQEMLVLFRREKATFLQKSRLVIRKAICVFKYKIKKRINIFRAFIH